MPDRQVARSLAPVSRKNGFSLDTGVQTCKTDRTILRPGFDPMTRENLKTSATALPTTPVVDAIFAERIPLRIPLAETHPIDMPFHPRELEVGHTRLLGDKTRITIGLARTFGALPLADTLISVEQELPSNDIPSIGSIVERVNREFSLVHRILRAHVSTLPHTVVAIGP